MIITSDLHYVTKFAKFKNNYRMIIMTPALKDIGYYHSTLSLKSKIMGDLQKTYLNILVKDPRPLLK